MPELLQHDRAGGPRNVDVFERFDRLFDDWARMLPFRRLPGAGRIVGNDEVIRVEERRDEDEVVVRAELPGVDPERDVQITVGGGMLNIDAERHEEHEEHGHGGFTRRELRYGTFHRSLPLPPGATGDDVTATYRDGILEVHVPAPTPSSSHKVPVTKG